MPSSFASCRINPLGETGQPRAPPGQSSEGPGGLQCSETSMAFLRGIYGPVPEYLEQTAVVGEHVAVWRTAEVCKQTGVPLVYYADCNSVVQAWAGGMIRATAPGRAHAGMWRFTSRVTALLLCCGQVSGPPDGGGGAGWPHFPGGLKN